MRTYLTGGDEGGDIIQGNKCHKAADVIDKPGGGIEFCITGIVASGSRTYGNRKKPEPCKQITSFNHFISLYDVR